MSDLTIEVVANPINVVPTAKGSYQVIDLAYKNKTFQDKLEGKKVMSFTNKDVFKALADAKFGDVFNVSRVKNEKGFWDWTAVSSGSGGNVQTNSASGVVAIGSPAPAAIKGNVSPKSNYETSEERAARQVLIVRQSSISSAVEFAVAHKVKDAQAVIAIAKEFEAYVFGKEPGQDVEEEAVPEPTAETHAFAGFNDDIPY